MKCFWFFMSVESQISKQQHCHVCFSVFCILALWLNYKIGDESASGWVTVISACTSKSKLLHGKNPNDIHSELWEFCGDDTVDSSTVSQWATCLHEGLISITDDPRSGKPITAMNNMMVVIVNSLLEEYHYMTWGNCSWNKHFNNMSF